MERVRFIQYGGREILLLDFSCCKPEEVYPLIEQAEAAIRMRPPQSLLTLTDVTDMRYDSALSQRMKEFTAHNKPYVRAAAVVGVSGLKKVLFEGIMLFSRRRIQAFDEADRAKAWLITA